MRLWTIQPLEVWESLRSKSLIYVDENAYKYPGHIPPAYCWLQKQLANRLGIYRGHLPWWAYCRKPDLRHYRHSVRAQMAQVRLEIEVDESSVIRFPCWAWHRVYCQDYLAYSRAEYVDWTDGLRKAVPDEDTWPLPQPWRAELEASWSKLFEESIPQLDWDESSFFSNVMTEEAVFEALQLDQVERFTLFGGRTAAGSNSH